VHHATSSGGLVGERQCKAKGGALCKFGYLNSCVVARAHPCRRFAQLHGRWGVKRLKSASLSRLVRGTLGLMPRRSMFLQQPALQWRCTLHLQLVVYYLASEEVVTRCVALAAATDRKQTTCTSHRALYYREAGWSLVGCRGTRLLSQTVYA